MISKSIENLISKERLQPYLNKHGDDFEKAINHYRANIKISEAFYPLMAVLEVALRNQVNHQLIRRFGNDLWFENPEFIQMATSFQITKIEDARKSILISKKQVTAGRVVSELTFGFWTSLFDSRFDKTLWRNLRFAFPNCPKKSRQRRNISSKINGIRKFRNRLFHHEAISWDFKAISNYKTEILECIDWLDKDLINWSKDLFRIEDVLETEKINIL